MTRFQSWDLRVGMRRLPHLRRRVLRLNYYRCHLGYFIFVILVCSAILYGSSASDQHQFRLGYPDALFMATSAITSTGLNTINLNSLNAYQQSVLFVLMILGDLSTVSISAVVVRRWMFRRQISGCLARRRAARDVRKNVDNDLANERYNIRHGQSRGPSGASDALGRSQSRPTSTDLADSRYDSIGRTSCDPDRHIRHYGGVTAPWETSAFKWLSEKLSRCHGVPHTSNDRHSYLSFKPTLDGKGRFKDLREVEYEELGGVEYRALGMLCWILPTYICFWVTLTLVILSAYSSESKAIAETIRSGQPGALSPIWWGVFMSISSYTNCGLNLLNANMVAFRDKWLILLVSGSAIAAGNTFYPIFLRAYVWSISKCIPSTSEKHHALSFLLHHSRRCYLWLFDSRTTRILLTVQVSLVLGEWVLFEILNIHQTAVWAIPVGTRVIDGLYQSFGTRSSGFYIVQISSIAPSLKIIYMIVMYLSVFPLIVSLRSTNEYEERSMGLEGDPYESNNPDRQETQKPGGNTSIFYHIKQQLAYDLWWIALSWLLICIVEEPQLNEGAAGFDIFAILFEVVSAYGNCGLTLGVPDDSYALSGRFHVLSKLIMIGVMLRGRHRILPMAIDRSVLLPGQGLMEQLDRDRNTGLMGNRDAIISQIRDEERGSHAERV